MFVTAAVEFVVSTFNVDNLFITHYIKDSFILVYASDYTLALTLKLVLCLLILILIRGGVPRYRYDFLTKIGWVKFLGYILTFFLTLVFSFLVW